MNIQSVETLLVQLQLALDSENWEQMQSLDIELKKALQELAQSNEDQAGKNDFAHTLERVANTYSKLIDSSEALRSKYQTELKQVNKEKKASNLYRNSSRF